MPRNLNPAVHDILEMIARVQKKLADKTFAQLKIAVEAIAKSIEQK